MKRHFLWLLVFIIGFLLIGFSIFIIFDIDFNDGTEIEGTFIGTVENADGSIMFPDGARLEFNDVQLKQNSYIEIKVSQVARYKNKYSTFRVLFSNDGTAWNDDDYTDGEVVDGRTFISVPGAFRFAHVYFEPDTVFKLEVVRLFDGIPIRTRHIIYYAVAAIGWLVISYSLIVAGNGMKKAHIKNLWRYSYMLSNLVKKDFVLKYRRSVLGILWSVLNPLLMAWVVSLVFSNIFRIQMEHFAIYFLSGNIIFSLMSEATNGCLQSIVGSGSLIKKVYIPKYIFPMEKSLFAFVNVFFSFIALLIIMPLLGLPPTATAFLFFIPMAYTLIFSFGLGMILASVNVFFRDMQNLYGVLVTAWMYLTPVMYPVELVPREVRWFLNINPMYYFVEYFRQIVMYNQIPDLRLNIVCLAFALTFSLFGFAVFKKTQRKFIFYL